MPSPYWRRTRGVGSFSCSWRAYVNWVQRLRRAYSPCTAALLAPRAAVTVVSLPACLPQLKALMHAALHYALAAPPAIPAHYLVLPV
jgi:hypothetical protein